MERLYTPWRMEYVTSTDKKMDDCIFCAKLADGVEADRENYVVYRGKATFAIMNLYPYNTGHLMILPNEHVARLGDVSPQAQYELMALTAYFIDLLTQLMQPDGFNVGLNLGDAAGAGIDNHLHLHLVPRWGGDNNFMSVVGETRVLPELLEDTYDRIIELLKTQPPAFPDR